MAVAGFLGWLVVGIFMLPVVHGGYNCSTSHILEDNADDFRENLKQACASLKVYLFSQKDLQMNLSAKSDKTGFSVWVWGGCDQDQGSDSCRDCINDLSDNLLPVCNNSSWGELTMMTRGKTVCYVHYNGVDYTDAAPTTLIQKLSPRRTQCLKIDQHSVMDTKEKKSMTTFMKEAIIAIQGSICRQHHFVQVWENSSLKDQEIKRNCEKKTSTVMSPNTNRILYLFQYEKLNIT